MANIVISRIQNRRGRRENLPQPLLPGEVALTSDTGQAWIGQDPTLAAASINVYTDQLESTAQGIVNNSIAESRFDESFLATDFNALVVDLTTSGAITVTANDILWDSTSRGEIITVSVDAIGVNYQDNDTVIAVSATGSAFIGTLNTTGGNIDSVSITSGGINYRNANTTFILPTAGGRSGGMLSVAATDILGSIVLIAADQNIDTNNTIVNVATEVAGSTVAAKSIGVTPTSAYGGVFANSSRVATNHVEAENAVVLINRVNSSTPGQNTGLVYTNLNIEITGGTNAGAVVLPYESGYYLEGIVLAANALKALHVTTQAVTFVSGAASRAYCNVVSTAEQIFDLQKNGVSFGSVTFAIGANVGTITIGVSTSFAAGDRLEVFGPALPDGTQDEIAITLTGTITV